MKTSKKQASDYPKVISCPDCGKPTWAFESQHKIVKRCWPCFLIYRKSTGIGCGEKLHGVWDSIKTRCYNPRCACYKYYGGKGITMCQEWRTNYRAFKAWAIEHGYKPGLTIHRNDHSKGYSPSNCAWVTRQYQSRHKVNTTPIEAVEAIKAMLNAGVPRASIMATFGVTKSVVSKIFRGKVWA